MKFESKYAFKKCILKCHLQDGAYFVQFSVNEIYVNITCRNFSEILLPLQTLMTVTLPSSAEVSTSHDPFPDDAVYIKGIEDVVEVLPSLQRPKKVTLRGSDGKLYIMLCKPKVCVDGLVQDCGNSIASALELLQSCTKPLIC